MSEVKLSQPRARVVLEDAGGQLVEYIVQTTNADAVRFDMTRTRLGWPSMGDAPMLWTTFCVWSAMKRAGDTTLTVDEFMEACLEVQPIDKEGKVITRESVAEAVAVDPTQPVVESGY